MQHIDSGDGRDKQGVSAQRPGAVHQHRQAGATDGPIPPGTPSSQDENKYLKEIAMRLLLATIAAAVAALSGEVVDFDGVPPVR